MYSPVISQSLSPDLNPISVWKEKSISEILERYAE
jgi:hypothetical protein